MTKKTIALTAVIVIAILAVGIFITLRKNKTSGNPSVSETTKEETDTSTETSGGKVSIGDLIAKGIPQKCTLEYSDGEMTTSSETWIKDGKFRQIMRVSSPESGKRVVNTISDGGYIYTWEDGSRSGNKIKIEEASGSQETNQETVDLQMNDQFEYKCTPAVITDAEFSLPANIEFKDLNAELEKLQEQFQNLPNQ